MEDNLYIIDNKVTQPKLVVNELESGRVLYLPSYSFHINPFEQDLLSESILHPKSKNISYNILTHKVAGIKNKNPLTKQKMSNFMQRYAHYTKDLITTFIPEYKEHLIWGRTSYRPAEIKDRVRSKRQDDTRLHVDAFPSSPVHGHRILRVFCNINPHEKPRTWHIGEPFKDVVTKFTPKIKPYNALHAKILKLFKITKTLRTAYDHKMLHIHDQMKLDENYQATCQKQRVDFPPNSTWIVFTDHVSHAALSGQYLMEQTFYLPINAMHNPELSPFKQLERV